MASISFTVNHGGAPLEGAEVVFGDVVGTALITDASGTVSATVPSDFAVFVATTIKHSSLNGGRRDLGQFLYVAGESYTFGV